MPFRSYELMEHAILTIKQADADGVLGEGNFFTTRERATEAGYGNPETVERYRIEDYGEYVLPICAIGHLANAAGLTGKTHKSSTQIVVEFYGLSFRETCDIAQRNDNELPGSRGEGVIALLNEFAPE